MKVKISFNLIVLLFFSAFAFAQLQDYSVKREIKGVSQQWHELELPPSVFEKVGSNLADIRIYNITPADTIETPYLLKIATEEHILKEIEFKLINVSSIKNQHFFTLEVPTNETLNEIILDFKNENFDWNIKLEASQNQSNWYTLLDKHRILSIKNNKTDYRFTHLNFKNAKYRYYRISFQSETKPELKSAKIYLDDSIDAQLNDVNISKLDISNQKESKQTILTLDLSQRSPISFVGIEVSNEFDYYRPLKIQYALDSANTEKGWKYNYITLFQGTLNSIEDNDFTFNSALAKKLKIIIENDDNQPLEIKDVFIKGYVHKLIGRFSTKGNYYLVYGNDHANLPKYDITHTTSNIPSSLSPLTLGKEQLIPKKQSNNVSPLFENKMWLWAVIGIIIVVLGAFTLKMMAKK